MKTSPAYSAGEPLRLAFFAAEFFQTPPRLIDVEENPGTGRTYLVYRKTRRILAVAIPEGTS